MRLHMKNVKSAKGASVKKASLRICHGPIQKDRVSCVVFALAFAKACVHSQQFSFDEVWKFS